jgi:ribosomal protein S18 acetylase RimI-like enzyme
MPSSVRQAVLADHAPIVRAIDEWWGGRQLSGLLPPLFLENFAGSSLVAEDGAGDLAGFLVGFDSPDHPGEAYVHFIGVRPDQRSAGLGRDLHERFARAAQTRGVHTVRCVTSTVNAASIAFHTALGFQIDGTDAPQVAAGIDDTHGHVRFVRRLG